MVEGWRGKRAGLTPEQRDTLSATLPGVGQFDEVAAAPLLPFELAPVWNSWGAWSELGPTTTVDVGGGGLAGALISLRDHRPVLYPARLAWLTENGYHDSDDRAAFLWLWSRLDQEQLRHDHEQVAAARQKAANAGG